MDNEIIVRHFDRMGAQVLVRPHRDRRGLRADVRREAGEERFVLEVGADADMRVVDVQPRLRHLLLLGFDGRGEKNKFLCGHDEREWFVAGVPNDRGVSGVRTALEALKPVEVRQAEERERVPRKRRQKRRNAAFVRQGEWFFLPSPGFSPGERMIVKAEPLRRTGGKAHIVDEAVRTGGESWYVSRRYPDGMSESRYRELILQRPELAQERWSVQRLNAEVYVRGRVRHPDHATVLLAGWHRVMMNTEHRAPAMRHVAFID